MVGTGVGKRCGCPDLEKEWLNFQLQGLSQVQVMLAGPLAALSRIMQHNNVNTSSGPYRPRSRRRFIGLPSERGEPNTEGTSR